MKVGLAYPAFYGSFKSFFPELEVIDKTSKMDYDLVIFPGGEDINPAMYGCNNTSSYFNNARDTIEKDVFYWACDKGVKMLGTCRGHQLLNVLLGGRLIQDLYTEGVGHGGNHGFDYKSNQPWIPDKVNSIHHQGIIRTGGGISILATYKGVIEAIASKSIITVQWHPEFMGDTNFFNYIKDWVNKKTTLDLSKSLHPKDYSAYYDKVIGRKSTGYPEHMYIPTYIPSSSDLPSNSEAISNRESSINMNSALENYFASATANNISAPTNDIAFDSIDTGDPT